MSRMTTRHGMRAAQIGAERPTMSSTKRIAGDQLCHGASMVAA